MDQRPARERQLRGIAHAHRKQGAACLKAARQAASRAMSICHQGAQMEVAHAVRRDLCRTCSIQHMRTTEARRGRAKHPPPWTFRPSAHRAVTCIRSAQGRPASVRPGFLPRARPLCRELPNEAAASPYADRRLTAEETTQNDAPACCVGRAAGTRTLRARRARRARRRSSSSCCRRT